MSKFRSSNTLKSILASAVILVCCETNSYADNPNKNDLELNLESTSLSNQELPIVSTDTVSSNIDKIINFDVNMNSDIYLNDYLKLNFSFNTKYYYSELKSNLLFRLYSNGRSLDGIIGGNIISDLSKLADDFIFASYNAGLSYTPNRNIPLKIEFIYSGGKLVLHLNDLSDSTINATISFKF